jgi:hypothetical protein
MNPAYVAAALGFSVGLAAVIQLLLWMVRDRVRFLYDAWSVVVVVLLVFFSVAMAAVIPTL